MATITHNNIAIDTGPASLLAPRECAYFLRFASGMSAKEIARELDVSRHTVDGARLRILFKLHADRMTAAINNAWRKGLIRNLVVGALVFGGVGPGLLVTDEPVQRTRHSQRLAGSRIRANSRRLTHV